MGKIINLTPHAINIIFEKNGTQEVLTIQPSGQIARCKVERTLDHEMGYTEDINMLRENGSFHMANHWMIPITKTVFGEIEGLPDEQPLVVDGKMQERTIYIVSSLVAQAVPDREDVFIPDDTVRDGEGKIIGCRSLGRI